MAEAEIPQPAGAATSRTQTTAVPGCAATAAGPRTSRPRSTTTRSCASIPESGTFTERVDEVQEAVVQCLDCMHDQPHLTFNDGRIEPVEDRWERMVTGTPWVASCTVMVDQDLVEVCSGPEAADSLTYGAFGDGGTREFFTHVRFHKHDEDKITIHLLVELYARTAEEAGEVLEEASRGVLSITSLAEESRPPAADSSRAALAFAARSSQFANHCSGSAAVSAAPAARSPPPKTSAEPSALARLHSAAAVVHHPAPSPKPRTPPALPIRRRNSDVVAVGSDVHSRLRAPASKPSGSRRPAPRRPRRTARSPRGPDDVGSADRHDHQRHAGQPQKSTRRPDPRGVAAVPSVTSASAAACRVIGSPRRSEPARTAAGSRPDRRARPSARRLAATADVRVVARRVMRCRGARGSPRLAQRTRGRMRTSASASRSARASREALASFEPLLQLLELRPQLVRQPVAEPREVLVDRRQLVPQAVRVDPQQLGHVLGAHVEAGRCRSPSGVGT